MKPRDRGVGCEGAIARGCLALIPFTRSQFFRERMVPRGGIESPTRGFSVLSMLFPACSQTIYVRALALNFHGSKTLSIPRISLFRPPSPTRLVLPKYQAPWPGRSDGGNASGQKNDQGCALDPKSEGVKDQGVSVLETRKPKSLSRKKARSPNRIAERVLRGGSWGLRPEYLRSAFRFTSDASPYALQELQVQEAWRLLPERRKSRKGAARISGRRTRSRTGSFPCAPAAMWR